MSRRPGFSLLGVLARAPSERRGPFFSFQACLTGSRFGFIWIMRCQGMCFRLLARLLALVYSLSLPEKNCEFIVNWLHRVGVYRDRDARFRLLSGKLDVWQVVDGICRIRSFGTFCFGVTCQTAKVCRLTWSVFVFASLHRVLQLPVKLSHEKFPYIRYFLFPFFLRSRYV